MRFTYTALDAQNKKIAGEMEAEGMSQVFAALAGRGLRPLSVSPVRGAVIRAGRLMRGSITISDKIFLTRYLSLMLKVGTDLFSALNILIENFDKPAMKVMLGEIREGLERGEPFHAAFGRYPKHFSPVFLSLVKAGEASGTLEKVFENLSVDLEKEQNLRASIKSALVYPALLFVMASLILLFLVTFALPKIATVFLTSGFEPPLFSRVVFTVGLFMGQYAAVIFSGFFALLVFLVLFSRTLPGKRALGVLLERLPVVRGVVQKIAVQRFAGTASSLLAAGLPILDVLTITASVVGHRSLQRSLVRVSEEGLKRGLTLGDAFRREAALPPVVVNLIAISERAGHLTDVLATIAAFYETEVQQSLKRLVVFLEPLMLLIIGAVIGLIALAIIVPVYQLVGQIE